MLFFFAGYEIDFDRIKGRPLELAVSAGGSRWRWPTGSAERSRRPGVILSYLYTGSAMATTAIGTLIPILSDAGEMRTRFGTYLLGAGGDRGVRPDSAGDADPLHRPSAPRGRDPDHLHRPRVITGLLAVRSAWRGWPLVERTFETSSQLAVRLAVVLVFALVALAAQLGLDLLLGGFVAGMITRIALRGREVSRVRLQADAVGYGLLIPFFFITSGMAFDLDALDLERVGALLKVPMFVGLFLVVRGSPALLLYRSELGLARQVRAGDLLATELPLVFAITTLAVDAGHMTAPRPPAWSARRSSPR